MHGVSSDYQLSLSSPRSIPPHGQVNSHYPMPFGYLCNKCMTYTKSVYEFSHKRKYFCEPKVLQNKRQITLKTNHVIVLNFELHPLCNAKLSVWNWPAWHVWKGICNLDFLTIHQSHEHVKQAEDVKVALFEHFWTARVDSASISKLINDNPLYVVCMSSCSPYIPPNWAWRSFVIRPSLLQECVHIQLISHGWASPS